MAKSKATLWTKITLLENKRKNAQGRIVKPMTEQERNLRRQAEKKRGTTAHGKAVSRGLRKNKANVKKAAKNASTKRQRAKTMQKVYHR